MRSRGFRACLHLIIALAVVLGIALPPAGRSESHDLVATATAEALRHAELAAQIETHGHSHDDGFGEEQGPGHSHGHNPGDHTHETPAMPPGGTFVMCRAMPDWTPSDLAFLTPRGTSRLDRPPRPISDT